MNISEIIGWIIANGPHFITALNAVLVALIALFMLIPGEQPEKFLQQVVDFISKFSLK